MKSRAVTFSPRARDDVLLLYDWIADRAGPGLALDYIGRLEAYCRGFDLASERGDRIRPESGKRHVMGRGADWIADEVSAAAV